MGIGDVTKRRESPQSDGEPSTAEFSPAGSHFSHARHDSADLLASKRAYQRPALRHLGRVSELTRGQNSGQSDDMPMTVSKHGGA